MRRPPSEAGACIELRRPWNNSPREFAGDLRYVLALIPRNL
jgi:hypothetical protein